MVLVENNIKDVKRIDYLDKDGVTQLLFEVGPSDSKGHGAHIPNVVKVDAKLWAEQFKKNPILRAWEQSRAIRVSLDAPLPGM